MKTTGQAAVFMAALASLASVVSAGPDDKETTERVSYTEPEAEPRASPPVPDGEWVELASPTPAKHGKEFISVDPDGGPYRQLRVEAASGKPIVQRVVVHYTDGVKRETWIGKALTARRPTAVVLLRGSAIDQIVVHTDRKSDGTYAVSAAAPADAIAAP